MTVDVLRNMRCAATTAVGQARYFRFKVDKKSKTPFMMFIVLKSFAHFMRHIKSNHALGDGQSICSDLLSVQVTLATTMCINTYLYMHFLSP